MTMPFKMFVVLEKDDGHTGDNFFAEPFFDSLAEHCEPYTNTAQLIERIEGMKCDLRIRAGRDSDIHREAYNAALGDVIKILSTD